MRFSNIKNPSLKSSAMLKKDHAGVTLPQMGPNATLQGTRTGNTSTLSLIQKNTEKNAGSSPDIRIKSKKKMLKKGKEFGQAADEMLAEDNDYVEQLLRRKGST